MTGEELKQIRGKLRLTQQAMGELLGVGRGWVAKMEGGESPIKGTMLKLLERIKAEV